MYVPHSETPLKKEQLSSLRGEPMYLVTFSSAKKMVRISEWTLAMFGYNQVIFVRASTQARLSKFIEDYGKTWLLYPPEVTYMTEDEANKGVNP